MILYESGAADAIVYDRVYGENEQHFRISNIAERALDAVLTRYATGRPVNVLELGCGQGEYLARCTQDLGARAGQCVGLDASAVGVRQCESREPTLTWIADTAQGFLASEHARSWQGAFDLVLNKSGTTIVASEAEQEWLLDGIKSLLAPHGVYAFLIHRGFYQVWAQKTCGDWKRDLFTVSDGVFGWTDDLPNRTSYVRFSGLDRATRPAVPASVARPWTPDEDEPQRIVVTRRDGEIDTCWVGGDERCGEQVRLLTALENETSSSEGPVLVVPGADSKRAVEAHRGQVDLRPISKSPRTIDGLVRLVEEMLAARPSVIVFGPGCPRPADDQERATLQWVAFRLRRLSGARLLWIGDEETARLVGAESIGDIADMTRSLLQQGEERQPRRAESESDGPLVESARVEAAGGRAIVTLTGWYAEDLWLARPLHALPESNLPRPEGSTFVSRGSARAAAFG